MQRNKRYHREVPLDNSFHEFEWPPFKGQFTRYIFVAYNMLMTSLGHKLFDVQIKPTTCLQLSCTIQRMLWAFETCFKTLDNHSERQFYTS